MPLKLPMSDSLLAGYLIQTSLSIIITKASSDNEWWDSDFCSKNGSPWMMLLALSAGVSIIAMVKTEKEKALHGLIAFVAAFLLNFGGYGIGYMAVYCSGYSTPSDLHGYLNFSIVIMVLASLVIFVHYVFKVQPQSTKIPHSDIILLGVCVNNASGAIILKTSDYTDTSCESGVRTGSWLLLVILSVFLAVLTWIKTDEQFNAKRSLLTLAGTFLLHLALKGTGYIALGCAATINFSALEYIVMLPHAILAFAIINRFLKKNQANEQHEMVTQNPNSTEAAPNQQQEPLPMAIQPTHNHPPHPASNSIQASNPPEAPNLTKASNKTRVPYPSARSGKVVISIR